jgi:hypothetical protein
VRACCGMGYGTSGEQSLRAGLASWMRQSNPCPPRAAHIAASQPRPDRCDAFAVCHKSRAERACARLAATPTRSSAQLTADRDHLYSHVRLSCGASSERCLGGARPTRVLPSGPALFQVDPLASEQHLLARGWRTSTLSETVRRVKAARYSLEHAVGTGDASGRFSGGCGTTKRLHSEIRRRDPHARSSCGDRAPKGWHGGRPGALRRCA